MAIAAPRWIGIVARQKMRQRVPREVLRDAISYLRACWQLRAATSHGVGRIWGRLLVRNRGRLILGDRFRIEGTILPVELVCHEGAELLIGDGTYFNYGVNVSATRSVRIGSECAFGQYVIVMDNDYHSPEDHWALGTPMPIVIEDNVWVGARSIILKGSHIGEGSVIGANSVVRGSIPPRSVAVGSPARVVRRLGEDGQR